MKKILLAAGVVIIVGLYVAFGRGSRNTGVDSPVAVVQAPTATSNQPSGTPPPQQQPAPTSTPSPKPVPVPTPAPTGFYKDGSYTGNTADAFYGPLQVKAVIQGGKLADVQFLKYPNDPGHTTEVSNSSLPKLEAEAIQAQSAQVNIISGATQTSEAFQQSLANALSQAKA